MSRHTAKLGVCVLPYVVVGALVLSGSNAVGRANPPHQPQTRDTVQVQGAPSGAFIEPGAVDQGGQEARGGGCGSTLVTQNTNPNTVDPIASVSCNAAGVNVDNYYARSFDMAVENPGAPALLKCVDLGVETNDLAYTIDVNIYHDPSGGIPDDGPPAVDHCGANDWILLATQPVFVPAATALSFVTANFGAGIALPADATIVVEVFTPDRQTTDNGSFFLGANSNGQSAESWIAAATCGLTCYQATSAIGFPDAMWVMRLDIDTVGTDFGACCDDAAGVCIDGIGPQGCAGRYGGDGSTCADFDPGCGDIGACCMPDLTCLDDMPLPDCVAAGGVFEPGDICGPGTCAMPCENPAQPPRPDDRFGIDEFGADTTRPCMDMSDCLAGISANSEVDCIYDVCYVRQNKYVSVDPNPANAGVATARRISLSTGEMLGWVDTPTSVTVAGPEPSPQLLARIVGAPVYLDWIELDSVHIGDSQVQPGYVYHIQAIGESCDVNDEAAYSAPLALSTVEFFGDVTGGTVRQPPDKNRNFKDINAVVRGFQSAQKEPKVWLDLQGSLATPEAPDFSDISFTDINHAVSGFQGGTYPYGPPEPPPIETRDTWKSSFTYKDVVSGEDSIIPAGFFGESCEHFEGTIEFTGEPLNAAATGDGDTKILRSGDPVAPADPVDAVGTVDITIEELNLVSAEPIVVLCDSGPQTWDVRATLSPTDPPGGSLTATKTHANGGTFDSMLYVQVLLTFTDVADPDNVLTLDTAGLSPPFEFTSFAAPFVHDLNPDLDIFVDPASSFVPGVREVVPGDIDSQVTQEMSEQDLLAEHGILPTRYEPDGEVEIDEFVAPLPAADASRAARDFTIKTRWKYVKKVKKVYIKINGVTEHVFTFTPAVADTGNLTVPFLQPLNETDTVTSQMLGDDGAVDDVSVEPIRDNADNTWRDHVGVNVQETYKCLTPTLRQRWTVVNGRPKVTPNGGAGAVFPITGVQASTVEKDVELLFRAKDGDGDRGRSRWHLTVVNIVQAGAPTNDLWWFNGANAANYSERVTLTADGAATGNFAWETILGDTKINFENGADTFAAANDNDVDILSTAASAAAATPQNDILVELQINGKVVQERPTMVLTPNRLVHLGDTDNNSGTGYQSLVSYRIEDQFNRVLPHNVEINEDWGATVSDFVGEDWVAWNAACAGDPTGENCEGAATVGPANWADNMTRPGPGTGCTGNPCTPARQNPQTPLGAVKADHRPGTWKCGSTTVAVGPGNNPGKIVRTLTWQLYRDHGRNE